MSNLDEDCWRLEARLERLNRLRRPMRPMRPMRLNSPRGINSGLSVEVKL